MKGDAIKQKFLLLIFLLCVVSLSFSVYTTYNVTGTLVFQNGTAVNNLSCSGISDAADATINVTLFKQVQSQNGPPVLQYNSSNTTNASGQFTVYFNIDSTDSFSPFSLQIKRYNCTGALTHMGPSFPPFPGQMYQQLFNNSNMTLYNASTLFINATNSTGGITNYSGTLMDTKYGYMVSSFMPGPGGADGTQNFSVDLLASRNYTLTLFKFGNRMNNEKGSAPRGYLISNSNLTQNTNSNNTFAMQIAINDSSVFVSGNLTVNASGLNGTDNINYTNIILYPYFNGKVPINGPGIDVNNFPPVNGDFGSYLNFTPAGAASYNLSAMGSASGLSYLMIIYAYNGSAPGAAGTRYFAGFQNITLVSGTNLTSFNMTLYELAGNQSTYFASTGPGTANWTTYFMINLQNNDSGNSNVNSAPLDILINYTNLSGRGPVNIEFVVQSNSSGQVTFPILKDNKFKFNIFGQQFAPVKKKINSTLNMTTIYLSGRQFNKPNSSALFSSLTMLFLKSNSTCNIQEPDLRPTSSGGCLIANFTAGSQGHFDPMKVMMNGENINIMIRDPNTGITGLFIGTDLFASGPPNMQLPDSATSSGASGGTFQKSWRFGSLAPQVFNYAYIGMPYSKSDMDDTQPVKILMTSLYDEDWNSQWSSSQGVGAVPADFQDYNQSMFNSSSNGLTCNPSDATSDCYFNRTTTMIWVKVPHFSGSDPQVSGTAITSAASSSSSSGTPAQQLSVGLSNQLICPDNVMELIATSSGSPVSDVSVRLILYNPYKGFRQEKTTDVTGKARFDLTNEADGNYQVDSSKMGYQKPYDVFFDFIHCAVAKQNITPVANTTNVTQIPQPNPEVKPIVNKSVSNPEIKPSQPPASAPPAAEQQADNKKQEQQRNDAILGAIKSIWQQIIVLFK